MTDIPPGDPHPTGEAPHGRHRLDTPVNVPPAEVDARRPQRWTSAALAAATAFLALANAHAIGEWFDELTPSPLTEPLRAPIGRWTQATASLGLDAPRVWLRTRWQAARARRFNTEHPGQQGAAAGGE